MTIFSTIKLGLSHVAYWIGHLFSLILNVIPDWFPDWTGTMFYRSYQSFMHLSSELDTHNKVWTKCVDVEATPEEQAALERALERKQ